MMRRACKLAPLILSVAAISSCATLDVNKLPAPGNSYVDGYTVVMEFDNVLNLPNRAKVTLDGKTVGIVTAVAATSHAVDVTSRIGPGVVVPSNIHAMLQQATVLGDVYIALDRAGNDTPAPPLMPGGRIPLAQTASQSQVEDTIARMADFVGSGSIQRIQNTIVGLNRVTPPPEGIRKVASRFAADITDLSENINNVDLLLQGVSQTGDVLHNRIPDLQYWFTPQGMQGFKQGLGITPYVGKGLPSVGSVYSKGFWLVPMLNSLADAMGAIQRSKWAFEDEVPAWRHLFQDYFLPQDKYPAINITSIVGPDGRELSGNVQDVLRILGATP